MNSGKKKNSKICTVVGACLLMAPLCVQWIWGNLSIYVLSYYHSRDRFAGGSSSWVISFVLFFRGFFLIISGYSIRVLGQRVTLSAGIFIFNIGIFSSYFALIQSITILNVTLGVLAGMGNGLIYGSALTKAIQWCDESDIGLITSIVQSAYPMAAVVINQFITMYLNPNNAKPDFTFQGYNLFSQEPILKQVPNIFLILGSCFSAIQILGFFIVREKSETKKTDIPADTQPNENTSISRSTTNSSVTESCVETPDIRHNDQDKTPKQMVLSLTFYILGSTYMFSDYSYLIVTNYYKIFGQLWIKDDHFLTHVGVVMVIFNVPSRLLCGWLIDKIGVKNTFISGFGAMSISCACMFVTPKINKYLYLIVTTFLASLTGATITTYTVATVLIFGQKYSITNFGCLCFVTLPVTLVAAPIMEFMVTNGDWTYLFYSGAGFCFVSLILTICFLPHV